MLLRPATPLAVVLFAAFALMLIAVLSTPVIESIPLGQFENVKFGVFGYCKQGNGCTRIGIGYDIASVSQGKPNSFDMPDSVRKSLVSILIVHPVAAFLCLVMFVMAVTAHFHSPSHSARYLLVFFILLVLTFLICLLAFLVDILLFTPHMAWGTYVVLAATILVAFGGVVTCAMRRAMTSRKARRKKIEENAEMSGENYYNREANNKANLDIGVSSQPSIPMVSGANQPGKDNLPAFASFEQVKKEDQVSDERVPLTQTSPTQRSNDLATAGAIGGAAAARAYASRSPSRDRYGNPTNGPPDAYGMARDPSFERSQSRGRGDMGGAYRGRGGPYNGRGGYGPPNRGRGGYGPPGRGGPRGGRGGYGPPPRGVYGQGGQGPPMRGGRSPPPMYTGGAYGRGPSNDSYAHDYSTNPSTNPSSAAVNNYDAYKPDSNLARAESPPPLPNESASLPEMDPRPAAAGGYGQYGQLRDSDVDVAGMVGLQQGKGPVPGPGRHDTYMSEGSKYSSDEQYVPPRQNWQQGSGRNSPAAPSPLNLQSRASPPAELPGRRTPNAAPAGNYYEDVDPRFAEPSPTHLQPQQDPMYEDAHAASGSRSPAESERSTFTSISQRGVNPRWNPPPPMPGQGLYPPPQQRRPQQQRQDMLLNNNPDFQLPGAGRTPGARGPGGGMIPGSAYPAGSI